MEMAKDLFPIQIVGSAKFDDWNVLAPAIAYRVLEDIEQLCLAGSIAARACLCRSAFDHTATLAWLSLAPDNHVPKWIAGDTIQRLKADDHARRMGRTVLDPSTRTEMERELAQGPQTTGGKPQTMPDLASCVGAVHERYPQWALDQLYVLTYRQHSGFLHPTPRGLMSSVAAHWPTEGTMTIGAPEPDVANMKAHLDLGCSVLATCLAVLSEATGIPEADRVVATYQESDNGE